MIHRVSHRDFVQQNLDTRSPSVAGQGIDGFVLFVKANWCGHCTSYLPKFRELSTLFPRYKFLVLESTENESLLQQWSNLARPAFTLKGYPTLVLFDASGDPVREVEDRFALATSLQ